MFADLVGQRGFRNSQRPCAGGNAAFVARQFSGNQAAFKAINGLSPEVMKTRKDFEKLTPIFPTEKFVLETEATNITARIIDLVSPTPSSPRWPI